MFGYSLWFSLQSLSKAKIFKRTDFKGVVILPRMALSHYAIISVTIDEIYALIVSIIVHGYTNSIISDNRFNQITLFFVTRESFMVLDIWIKLLLFANNPKIFHEITWLHGYTNSIISTIGLTRLLCFLLLARVLWF